MALTPSDVANKRFSTTRLRPGYDEDEVDVFLDEVEETLSSLIREVQELRSKIAELTQQSQGTPLRSPSFFVDSTANADSSAGLHTSSEARNSWFIPKNSAGNTDSPTETTQSSALNSSSPDLEEAARVALQEGSEFGAEVARDAPSLWLEAVLARKPRMPSDLEARLLQRSALPVDWLLNDEIRHALRKGFWKAIESACDQPTVRAQDSGRVAPDTPQASSGHQLEVVEQEIDLPDGGTLRRFGFGDHDFLIVDYQDGNQTINWTTDLKPQAFAALAGEYISPDTDEHAVATISMNGIIGELDARLGIALTETTSPSFDDSCDFYRIDHSSLSMALQVLPRSEGGKLGVLGISADTLSTDMVYPLIIRTATREITENTRKVASGSLLKRLGGLIGIEQPKEERKESNQLCLVGKNATTTLTGCPAACASSRSSIRKLEAALYRLRMR